MLGGASGRCESCCEATPELAARGRRGFEDGASSKRSRADAGAARVPSVAPRRGRRPGERGRDRGRPAGVVRSDVLVACRVAVRPGLGPRPTRVPLARLTPLVPDGDWVVLHDLGRVGKRAGGTNRDAVGAPGRSRRVEDVVERGRPRRPAIRSRCRAGEGARSARVRPPTTSCGDAVRSRRSFL